MTLNNEELSKLNTWGKNVSSLDITSLKNSRANINIKYLYIQTALSYTTYYHIFKLRADLVMHTNTEIHIYLEYFPQQTKLGN